MIDLFLTTNFNEQIYLTCLICISTCITSFALVCAKNLIKSIIYAAFFSVNICLLYLMLDAPDVAMTEAAIGACLSTVILFELVKKIPEQTNNNKYNLLALIIIILLAYLLIKAGEDLVEYGFSSSPLNAGLSSQHYINNTQKEIGIHSIAAAILASYRGFDTLGETLVIVIAGMIVTLILNSTRLSNNQVLHVDNSNYIKKQSNMLVETTTLLILPLSIYYALFIQINGESSPGGGFQAGAILASMIIGLNMINDKISDIKLLRRSSLIVFSALGVFIYALTGMVNILTDTSFLNYSILGNNIHKAQFMGIFIVELGVGISVTATLVLIYKQFLKAR